MLVRLIRRPETTNWTAIVSLTLLGVLSIASTLPPAATAFFAATLIGFLTLQSSERAIRETTEAGVLEATGRLSVLESATMADLLQFFAAGNR